MYFACFQRRAYNAVQTGFFRIACIVHNNFIQRSVDQQVFFHSFFACGCQLCYCDQQGTSTVGSCQAFQCCFHHCVCTCCMQVCDINVQIGQYGHCFFYCCGDVVQFQIQEDFVASFLDFFYDSGTFCIEQFHTHFQERFSFFVFKVVQKCHQFCLAVKVAGNDYVSVHLRAPPIISFRSLMLYFSITRGRSSMISLQI